MSTESRNPTPIFAWTLAAIAVLAVIGAVAGFYLGQRYRSRSVQIVQQPSPVSTPPVSSPAPAPPEATTPTTAPLPKQSTPSSPSSIQSGPGHPSSSGTPVTHHQPVGKHPGPKTGAVSHGPARTPRSAATAKAKRVPSPAPLAAARKKPNHPPLRSAQRPKPKPLELIGTLPPERPLPVPRQVRQQRVARSLAAARPRPVRIATHPRVRRRRRARLAYRPDSHRSWPLATSVAVVPPSAPSYPADRFRPAGAYVPSPTLVRAAQRVRYVEQAIVLEGRPAMLTTYVVWNQRQPRTFSFVRQERRTDLARIVGVDEATRLVRVFVPSRGALIQVVVPATAVIAYAQALRTDPPSPELVARADALGGPGPGIGPPMPPAAAPQPAERVAGMREQLLELVGLVRSVDPASRRIILAGPREKTPFRVAEGVDLPRVGQIVSISTTPDGRVLPRPALGITPLQPTVAGIVTRVRPTAVELSVRTVTPEGRVQEVPVPVSGNARVFISEQPGDLRALRQGIFIRAYMTATGETRILGLPSEAE